MQEVVSRKGVRPVSNPEPVQVLHGCRQLVPRGVPLSRKTSATLAICCHLWSLIIEHSDGTARVKWEEGEDDVKSAWPLCPGLHTCYNA